MRRRSAFTLVELLVVIGIIALLVAILLPVVGKMRQSSKRVACASNLRQIGTGLIHYFNDFKQHLPARWDGLELANPHVFRFRAGPEDVSELMERYAGSRDVYYCPSNFQDRTAAEWWPYRTGTIAASYQFMFWMDPSAVWTEKQDYKRLTSTLLLAADALASSDGATKIVFFNHELDQEGQPKGMNLLFGDGHVQWQDNGNGFVHWTSSVGRTFWHYAQF
jgi:prepilin-type N-terminal cleavage/methylation domain-containing protein/prepilin-type processing-associated H-X9-DG protein